MYEYDLSKLHLIVMIFFIILMLVGQYLFQAMCIYIHCNTE